MRCHKAGARLLGYTFTSSALCGQPDLGQHSSEGSSVLSGGRCQGEGVRSNATELTAGQLAAFACPIANAFCFGAGEQEKLKT